MPDVPIDLSIHNQIESAQTLASRFYTDPAILELEKERIFRRTWQLVGTLSQPCGPTPASGLHCEGGQADAKGASGLPSFGMPRTLAGGASAAPTGALRQTQNSERERGAGAAGPASDGGSGGSKCLTISDPETFFTTEVIGEPVVVVRDKQGTLRAFSNVCRHRAGPIAQGCGSKNVLRCAYHGWTYTLDGRLIGTPDIDGVEFFDRSTMAMVPLRCETWEQFIFVNFDPNAESLAAFLGKIPEQVRGFEFAGLELAERRDYVIECNWKVYVDNYLEGYHIPIAHPGLMREIDYAQYRTETFRYYSQQFAPIRGVKPDLAPGGGERRKSRGDDVPKRGNGGNSEERFLAPQTSLEMTEVRGMTGSVDGWDEAGDRVYAPGTASLKEALYFWIFPNLMLNIYPDNISTNVIVPLGHDKTLTIFEWFFHDARSEKTKARIERAVKFSDEVQQEDIELCRAVQRGLNSATYDRGRYSVKRENGVHHFHLLLSEFLART